MPWDPRFSPDICKKCTGRGVHFLTCPVVRIRQADLALALQREEADADDDDDDSEWLAKLP
jgi:hypothetical protein